MILIDHRLVTLMYLFYCFCSLLGCVALSLQSLIFLGCVAAAGLGLNLLCLAVYLSCLCCCRREEEEESKKPGSCCVTWSAVAAGLITW